MATVENKDEVKDTKQVCGIIMPISSIDGCPSEHWAEVQRIISEAINDAGYKPNLVSDAEDIGIIQKRIIQNIYDNAIVVCDVSGKNPNVMFELGLRLAFDKPAIIVIDDKTDYSFDTSPIEHLSYPRDLRYSAILSFKEQLKKRIIATVEKAHSDPNYTTFLKNFGEFEVAHVEKKKGSMDEVVLSRLDEMIYRITKLERRSNMRESDLSPSLDNEKARKIIRDKVEDYCIEKGIPFQQLKEDSIYYQDQLFRLLEKDDEIRRLCGTPSRLRFYLETILSYR